MQITTLHGIFYIGLLATTAAAAVLPAVEHPLANNRAPYLRGRFQDGAVEVSTTDGKNASVTSTLLLDRRVFKTLDNRLQFTTAPDTDNHGLLIVHDKSNITGRSPMQAYGGGSPLGHPVGSPHTGNTPHTGDTPMTDADGDSVMTDISYSSGDEDDQSTPRLGPEQPSTLTPEDEALLVSTFDDPNWPYNYALYMSERISPDDLKALAYDGDINLMAAIEGTEEEARVVLTRRFGTAVDPWLSNYQRPPISSIPGRSLIQLNQISFDYYKLPDRAVPSQVTAFPARHWRTSLRSDWSLREYNPKAMLLWPQIQRTLGALETGYFMEPRPVDVSFLPHGPFTAWSGSQNKHYRSFFAPNVDKPPTRGTYHVAFNFVDGIIVVQSATSPSWRFRNRHSSQEMADQPRPSELPDITFFSDWLWAVWIELQYTATREYLYGRADPYATPEYRSSQAARQQTFHLVTPITAKDDEHRLRLRYVVFQSVHTAQCVSAVHLCLKSRIPNYDENHTKPRWEHRETFPLGHWCFYTLLATPPNISLAYLLMQHKTRSTMGHYDPLRRTIPISVTIFYPDPPDGLPSKPGTVRDLANYPVLIWELGLKTTSNKYPKLRDGNEAQWQNTPHWESNPPNIEYPQLREYQHGQWGGSGVAIGSATYPVSGAGGMGGAAGGSGSYTGKGKGKAPAA